MSTYELSTSKDDILVQEPTGQGHLGSAVLIHNAVWFTKVRWIVAAVFALAGLVGVLLPGTMKNAGIVLPSRELWILAGILVILNTVFYTIVSRLNEGSPRKTVETYIWLQIITDLLIVTVLVHLVGSTVTFIAFTYLFHIALACIFFPKKNSLLVTLLAAGLYLALVSLELTGVWPRANILSSIPYPYPKEKFMSMFFAGSAVFIWLIVWYLVSTLSEAVRKRDQQLSAANQRLIKADQEKTQQVLITTHELKAPFAGIESNIQILKFKYWNEIQEPIRAIINKIDTRAQTLRERIREILVLGDLKSQPTREKYSGAVDLKMVIHAVLEEIAEKAKDRNISIDVDVPSIEIPVHTEKLKMLFSNLVSNAISYSHQGGNVKLSAQESRDEILVSVSDHGIGIRDDALPHIFDEYFRTKEASKFNKMSTGLGLAMVKEIARNSGLGIKVTSELGKGTTFEVTIPKNRGR
jgi:two-component system phosphate regulon sensor histidine kinase PhoR